MIITEEILRGLGAPNVIVLATYPVLINGLSTKLRALLYRDTQSLTQSPFFQDLKKGGVVMINETADDIWSDRHALLIYDFRSYPFRQTRCGITDNYGRTAQDFKYYCAGWHE